MSNLPAGAEFESKAPWNDESEHECPVCDTPVDTEGPCSNACFEADLM